MKVLQVCHKMPFPPVDGGAQVMHFTTRGLLECGIEVKVLAVNPTRNLVDIRALPEDYRNTTRFESVVVDTRLQPASLLSNLFGDESYFTERFSSADFEKRLTAILKTENFDIVQLEHLYLCKYIPAIRAGTKAKVVLRPQNIEHMIWERYRKSLRNPVKRFFLNIAVSRLKKFEQGVKETLDGIAALTKEDGACFLSFPGKTRVTVVPMGYDYGILSGFDFERQYCGDMVVYHLASMDWLPNVEAVSWFLKRVLPILQKQKAEVKISIAGRGMPSWVYRYKSKSIEVLGDVTTPLAYQEDKPVMIVPLWSGSGIRAKIIEGLALGKTIISTSIGAQGIEYENGRNLLIADTPDAFARQIIRVTSDRTLCRETGQRARELGSTRYFYLQSAKALIEFYHHLLNSKAG